MMSNGNQQFGEILQQRVAEKETEYKQLLHEQSRLTVRIGRARDYLVKLNALLEAEGLVPVRLAEAGKQSGFARPGNRSNDMPVRKPEWDSMSLTDSVLAILGDTPTDIQTNMIVHRIYEIGTHIDEKKAKRTLLSTLRQGVKRGLWESPGKNRYRAIGAQQGALLHN